MVIHSHHNISRQGFTLIEIMVVVITLGVISSLALISYNKVVERGHCTNAKENLRRIHSAAQLYALKNPGVTMPVLTSTIGVNHTFKINIVDPYFNYSTYIAGPVPPGSTGYADRLGGPIYRCSAPFGIPLNETNPGCNNLEYCDSAELP